MKELDMNEKIRELWDRAKEGRASKEDIEYIYGILEKGKHGLSPVERRLIEGDLQDALSKL